ncbi:hypothetical protein D779_3997 [Imhoffiella purpurea]|uniref:Uncharacterized protein n=1 Tax=Imhoffiella purpurea TaxID=1249627 RepID=W9VS03_9GAMM|nr:hypothetical protein D779_3997 [Imhoffiella purpurea]
MSVEGVTGDDSRHRQLQDRRGVGGLVIRVASSLQPPASSLQLLDQRTDHNPTAGSWSLAAGGSIRFYHSSAIVRSS